MNQFKSLYVRSRASDGNTDKAESIMAEIHDFAQSKGLEVYKSPLHIKEDTLAVSVGGDGTFLRTAKIAFGCNIPITGFNLGRKGFLVDNEPDNVWNDLEEMLYAPETNYTGEFSLNERHILGINHNGFETYAINEVYVAPESAGLSLETEVYVNGVKAIESVGSGVIVSSPSGSTAFSLSAGGPVLTPDSRSVVITPVMPHTLASRPLVVSNNDTVEIMCGRGFGSIYTDGGFVDVVSKNNPVTVQQPDRYLKVLQRHNWNFYDTLREKMSWNS